MNILEALANIVTASPIAVTATVGVTDRGYNLYCGANIGFGFELYELCGRSHLQSRRQLFSMGISISVSRIKRNAHPFQYKAQ